MYSITSLFSRRDIRMAVGPSFKQTERTFNWFESGSNSLPLYPTKLNWNRVKAQTTEFTSPHSDGSSAKRSCQDRRSRWTSSCCASWKAESAQLFVPSVPYSPFVLLGSACRFCNTLDPPPYRFVCLFMLSYIDQKKASLPSLYLLLSHTSEKETRLWVVGSGYDAREY